ncbi:hypothetical protein RZS08_25155, partial [Arthrospira platensis SPKY1]|nr:hypothetical protein [Arthrospira platensis SPKY1]
LTVNMGGALGDSSWITADDGPMISFQVPTDPFAPCGIGTVLVPPPINLPVVEVVGACYFQNQIAAAGLNSAFANFAFADEVTNIAKARNGGVEGFLPFPSSDPAEGAPWNYSASAEPYGVAGSDCDTDSETAHVYIDSIMQYFLPRACLTLDLGCDLWPFTSTKEVVTPAAVQLQILP